IGCFSSSPETILFNISEPPYSLRCFATLLFQSLPSIAATWVVRRHLSYPLLVVFHTLISLPSLLHTVPGCATIFYHPLRRILGGCYAGELSFSGNAGPSEGCLRVECF
ncbi:hypothetical protein SOVF_108620, partial [Spinacia oleracea]